MNGDRYSNMNRTAMLGFFAAALDSRSGRTTDGDSGASFPQSDADDLGRGARFIPGEVTMARRGGQRVNFITECSLNCWYWVFPDGKRIFHWDPATYAQIAEANGKVRTQSECGEMTFKDGVGPCPHCQNPHTIGGIVAPDGPK